MASYKKAVQAHGEYVLDYVGANCTAWGDPPCWFIGRGRVAGNTVPIPSGLHATPRQAWQAAAVTLKLKAA